MENERRIDRTTSMGMDEHRLSDILHASQIKATDIYETPPQIIWIDNSTIATLGNFSASTGKAKSKKTFNVSALVAASLAGKQVLNYRAHLPEGKQRILYVDTEQSRFHCRSVLERILRLAGLPTTTDPENLDFFCLREYIIWNNYKTGHRKADHLFDLLFLYLEIVFIFQSLFIHISAFTKCD